MPKTFTPAQANNTLPLVTRIVGDIVSQYARWQEKVRAFEVYAAAARADHPEPAADALQAEVEQLAVEIDGCVRELEALGVEFKGFDAGLVDFPGEIDGRPVYLCWQLGEPAVEYWHERSAGFAGRQRLVEPATA